MNRTSLKSIRFALVLAILLIAISACSRSGGVDGPVLTSPSPSFLRGGGGGTDAIVSGTVFYDESSECLFLAHGEHRTPVVWPNGASWQAEPPAIRLRGQLIEPGMTVSGSGGYFGYESIKDSSGAEVADAARACAGTDLQIAFFNKGSRVRVETD